MKKNIWYFAAIGAAGLLAIIASRSTPHARKARLMARASRDFNSGRIDAAEIEYLNVLRLDRLNGDAIAHLGIIYFDEGRGGMALPYLLEGRRLQPDNLPLRLRLGLYFLALGRFSDSRAEANYLLARRPGDGDGLLLLAESAIEPKDIADARRRLTPQPGQDFGNASARIALGTLDFRQRLFPEAELLFTQALAADPKSSDAHTALAALHWARGELARADRDFEMAVTLAPGRSSKQLQYAEFKIQTGDAPAARRMLEQLNQKDPDFLPGILLLAELDEEEKQFARSTTLVESVLVRAPTYLDALLLQARLKQAAGKPAEAVAGLERTLAAYPRNPRVEYELAQGYVAEGSMEKAAEILERTVLDDPGLEDAALLLAGLRLRLGDPASAVIVLKHVILRRPGSAEARLLLASAYIAQGNLDEALGELRQLAADFPGDFRPILYNGIVLLRQGDKAAALRDFDRALALAPESPLAWEQRIDFDLEENLTGDALQRLEAQLARSPNRPDLYVLLGRVFLARRSQGEAEAAWLKAIALQPGAAAPHYLLAELYSKTGRDPLALASLRELVAADPSDKRALLAMAAIDQRDQDLPSARATYEKLLAVDPDFAPALNNLAWLYGQDAAQLDKALDLAGHARRMLPADPRVADTLGWILYEKHQYPWALSLLKESAAGLPADAQVQFHLGMAYAQEGDETAARLALQGALERDGGFSGNRRAREDLAILAIDPQNAAPGVVAQLEKASIDRPDDPIVLSRLAAAYERHGEADKAIAVWAAALRDNPETEPALIGLARLYAARGDTARALSLAKSARDLAPADPEVARVLGVLAYRSRDYPWSVGLLTEAAAGRPGDPELSFDLAKALYAVGRVADSEATLRSLAAPGGSFSRSGQARSMLAMIETARDPTPAKKAPADAVLEGDPGNVPALMALGAIAVRAGDDRQATADFEKALDADPDFLPAERSLVLLYAGSQAGNPRALAIAGGAREAFPDDPLVARAAGIVMYRNANYTMAESLLEESSRDFDHDGELMFYLGMARYRLNEKSGRGPLERALALDPAASFSTEARLALANIK